jgi:UDP-glucose 4-epimerase
LLELVTEIKPDLICHLAAHVDVRESVADPRNDVEVNVVGTVNVLEAARAVGARVIFASTGGALYGEDAPIPSSEDTTCLPGSPYGVAKYCAEQYIGLYNRLFGTEHTILRFANVYGPRQGSTDEGGVVSIFCSTSRRVIPPPRPPVRPDNYAAQKLRDHTDTPPGILTNRQKCANRPGKPVEATSIYGEPRQNPLTITAESS